MLWERHNGCQGRVGRRVNAGQLTLYAAADVMTKSPLYPLRPFPLTNSSVTVNWRRACLVLALSALGLLLMGACGDDDDSGITPTAVITNSPTPVPTLLPPDADAGTRVFQEFVAAVQADDMEGAWGLYAASIEGTTEEYNADFGCEFGAFSYEFPRLQHLFERMAPFAVTETYGAAPGSATIEMRLLGANGTSFL